MLAMDQAGDQSSLWERTRWGKTHLTWGHWFCFSTQQWVSFDSAKLQLRRHNWSGSTRWLVGPGMEHIATLQITAKHHSMVPVEYWKHWEAILLSVNYFSASFCCSPYFRGKNTQCWLLCALAPLSLCLHPLPCLRHLLSSATPQAGSSLRDFTAGVPLRRFLCLNHSVPRSQVSSSLSFRTQLMSSSQRGRLVSFFCFFSFIEI